MLRDSVHVHTTLHYADRQFSWCMRKPVSATMAEFARGRRQRRERDAYEMGYVEFGGES